MNARPVFLSIFLFALICILVALGNSIESLKNLHFLPFSLVDQFNGFPDVYSLPPRITLRSDFQRRLYRILLGSFEDLLITTGQVFLPKHSSFESSFH